MKKLLLLITMLTISCTAFADSIGAVCSADDCRLNVQMLERDKGNKLYINYDQGQNYSSAKVVAHIGNEELHLSAIGTFRNVQSNYIAGFGVDFNSNHLLGVDIGIDNSGKPSAFAYWGLPVIGRVSSDGFIQINGNNAVSRGNLMYNFSRYATGYEVTLVDGKPTHELKAKVNF